MRKYQASNRVPFGSFVLLVVVGIASAVGLGLALWEIANLMQFLAIVIVIISGAILGGILSLIVRVGKVRSPLMAGFIGFLLGVLLYGVYQYAGYRITFYDEMRAIYAESAGKVPGDTLLNQELDAIMQDEVGSTGFVGYLLLTAKYGISLSSSPDSTSNIDLTDAGVWAYWAFEMLAIAVLAAWLPARAAQKPFDEDANAWYGTPVLLASTTAKQRKDLLNNLRDGDFMAAGRTLTTGELKYPRMDVLISRSPQATDRYAQQDVYVTVNYVQRKGRSNAVRTGVISPSELDTIQMGMAQGAAAFAEGQPLTSRRR